MRTWGSATGRPVFFWHPLGAVASGAWVAELAPILTQHYGLRLVAVDGPGFGASPALPVEEYDVLRLADLAWGVIDSLRLERPVLMGHSWGGVVVTCAAAARARDVAGLVLLDAGHLDYADLPGTAPDQSFEDRVAAVEASREQMPDRESLRAAMDADMRRPVTDLLMAGIEPAVRQNPDGSLDPIVSARTVAAVRQALVRERSSARWPALATTGIPVLLLLATEPEQTRRLGEAGLRHLQEVLPHVDARFMRGWGHDLVADGGPDLAHIVGEWVAAL